MDQIDKINHVLTALQNLERALDEAKSELTHAHKSMVQLRRGTLNVGDGVRFFTEGPGYPDSYVYVIERLDDDGMVAKELESKRSYDVGDLLLWPLSASDLKSSHFGDKTLERRLNDLRKEMGLPTRPTDASPEDGL